MVEWAHASSARSSCTRDDAALGDAARPRVRFWEGETRDLGGLTLIRSGGHFAARTSCTGPRRGGRRAALRRHRAGDPRPALRRFMYSYPNLIPLPAAEVQRIADALAPYAFDTIYGAWFDRVIERDGSAVVRRSVDRYIRAVTDPDSVVVSARADPRSEAGSRSRSPERRQPAQVQPDGQRDRRAEGCDQRHPRPVDA